MKRFRDGSLAPRGTSMNEILFRRTRGVVSHSHPRLSLALALALAGWVFARPAHARCNALPDPTSVAAPGTEADFEATLALVDKTMGPGRWKKAKEMLLAAVEANK